MSFADELAAAAESPVAILQEFLLQHEPREERIHAFCEGYEDPFFYRPMVEKFAKKRRTFFYHCRGKWRLLEVFRQVTTRVGEYQHTLYFLDKDFSDLLNEQYPADSRIYVTEYYSIENYLACEQTIRRICTDFVTVKKCVLPMEMVVDRFREELRRFHSIILPLMAWTLCLRRSGFQVVLQNIDLGKMFILTPQLRIERRRSAQAYLLQVTGAPERPRIWRELRREIKNLRNADPKHCVRGKFETWFLVQFVKAVYVHLEVAAQAVGGSVSIAVRVEQSNAVALLGRMVATPQSLTDFLTLHLGPPEPEA